MDPAIVFDSLTFTYGGRDRPALDHIQASVSPGRWIVVMGREGAGKSSLCLTLNGLIPHFYRGQYRGRVLAGGREPSKEKVAAMSGLVGLVLQDFEAQLFCSTVELEMAFGPENQGRSRMDIGALIGRHLKRVGLTGMERREPDTLSGGEKQRLAIGSILTMEPDILVFDETTTDLDPAGQREIYSLARSFRQEGRTLVMVDQDPEAVMEADQIWLLTDGGLGVRGTPRDVFRDPAVCRQAGLRVPALVELFQRLGRPEVPWTVEEALALLRKQDHGGLPEPGALTGPTPPSGPAFIEADRVGYTYPRSTRPVLSGIDLQVHRGEFLALLGPNGSGKSTLARLLNGLIKPSAGQVRVNGRPTTGFSPKEMAGQVGYVFQNPDHQLFARTVEEEVGFGPKAQGADADTVRSRVREALEAVDMSGTEKREPFALTRGERQRIAVASMLAARPAVLILDEPTTGLDYGHQRGLLEMLRRLNAAGHAVVIITHHLWLAAEFCHRSVVLREGRMVEDGPTREVFRNEARLREAALIVPPIVRLSNRLGTRGMTVDELSRELPH